MKKLLIIACSLCIMSAGVQASETKTEHTGVVKYQKPNIEHKMLTPEQITRVQHSHEVAFEQRLGLTEVQKLKARELRKNGHEKMKPVMEEIKTKKPEAESIRHSDLTVQAKEEKLTVIDNDLKILEKQAQTIRKQNMKDFESILTGSQKKTLKKMKKEGRKNFDKNRKQLPPPPCKPVAVK